MKKLEIEKQLEEVQKSKVEESINFIFGVVPGTKIIADMDPAKFWVWEGNYYREKCIKWIKANAKLTYPNWTPNKIDRYLRDLSYRFYIGDCDNQYRSPSSVNCINGVLEVNHKTGELVFRDHEPEKDFFFEKPEVKYNPKADTTEAERLLKCLEEGDREILLRTLAATFDLKYLRSKRNRPVKALFLQGKGNNGKDTLRAITERLFGKSRVAHVSPEALDKANTDHRYFGITGLYGASVNWCSEVKVQKAVEENSFLKAVITGDPVPYEKKNHDPIWYEPCCINLFGTNHDIYNNSNVAAFSSRFGLLIFDKTYSDKPKHGELQADSRFRDDPDFIRTQVLSGFLRLLKERWDLLLTEGIDFTSSDSNWESVRGKMSHLYDFIAEIGLDYDPDYEFGLTTKEIWEQLTAFYQREGIMRNGKVIAPDPRRGDPYLQHLNQVAKRFAPLFPAAKQDKRNIVTHDKNSVLRRKFTYFHGLRFRDPIVDRVPYAEDEERVKLCGQLVQIGGQLKCSCEYKRDEKEGLWIQTHELTRREPSGEWVLEPLSQPRCFEA